jgi:hypothetical protein
MTLTQGYAATSTGAYTITGTSPVTVAKTKGDSRITWNSATLKLDIAEGLATGVYTVELTAKNSAVSVHFTFALRIDAPVYWIGVGAYTGGTVASSPLYVAKAGETVTLTVAPAAGSVLESILVNKLDNSMETVPLTRSGHVCTFTMPAYHVYVAPVFRFERTSIEDIQSDLKAYVQDGVLHVSGLTAGQPWRVYNIFGVAVYQGVANAGTAEVALPGRGTYIVTDGREVVKIAN